ncbi:hypothetical protein AX16_010962 [Volvariella volvacea WC 439]|nr:hypothetical protein AX16_010962 [Volvariella volvacea WC 439]
MARRLSKSRSRKDSTGTSAGKRRSPPKPTGCVCGGCACYRNRDGSVPSSIPDSDPVYASDSKTDNDAGEGASGKKPNPEVLKLVYEINTLAGRLYWNSVNIDSASPSTSTPFDTYYSYSAPQSQLKSLLESVCEAADQLYTDKVPTPSPGSATGATAGPNDAKSTSACDSGYGSYTSAESGWSRVRFDNPAFYNEPKLERQVVFRHPDCTVCLAHEELLQIVLSNLKIILEHEMWIPLADELSVLSQWNVIIEIHFTRRTLFSWAKEENFAKWLLERAPVSGGSKARRPKGQRRGWTMTLGRLFSIMCY